MGETIRLSQCYSLDHGIEVKDDDSFYSKIEMIATGMLSSQLSGTLGIQAILYNAWRNSWGAREFTKYPLDMCLRISHTFEECCVRVVKGGGKEDCRAKCQRLILASGKA